MIPLARARKAFVLRRKNVTPSFEILLHLVTAFSDAPPRVDFPTQLISPSDFWYLFSQFKSVCQFKSAPLIRLPISEIPPALPLFVRKSRCIFVGKSRQKSPPALPEWLLRPHFGISCLNLRVEAMRVHLQQWVRGGMYSSGEFCSHSSKD